MPVPECKFAHMAKFFRLLCVPERFDWKAFWSPKCYHSKVHLPLEYDWHYPRKHPMGEVRGYIRRDQERGKICMDRRLQALMQCSRRCHVPTLVTFDWRGENDDQLTFALKGENAACRQALIDLDKWNQMLPEGQRMWKSAVLDDFIDDEIIGPYSMTTYLILTEPNWKLYSLEMFKTILMKWAEAKTVANTWWIDDINVYLNTNWDRGMRAVPRWMVEAYHPTFQFMDYRLRHWSMFKY